MPHLDNTQPASQFLDIVALAERLQVSRTTIKRWHKSGAMPQGIRIGPRLLRWDREQIQRWIEAGCPACDPPSEPAATDCQI